MQELSTKTKSTGLEHGMKFCKKDDEIIVDEICVGDICSIAIESEQCATHVHDFHTHPSGDSDSSVADLYNLMYHTYWADRPTTGCIKGVDSNLVICSAPEGIPTFDDMANAHEILKEFNKTESYSAQKIAISKIAELISIPKQAFPLGENIKASNL
jgi:hypothetical protein